MRRYSLGLVFGVFRATTRVAPTGVLYVVYFVLSLFGLSVEDGAPWWVVVLLVLNFVNAGRLVRRVRFYAEG